MAIVYVSVGSNIERERHIRSGINALKERFGALTLSSVYESAAIGFEGDSFLNLIVAFETALNPLAVDTLLAEIEQDNGRTKAQKKFNPRTLDLDLVLYDDFISNDPLLNIPRDEITRYAFVLEPLAEIAPHQCHPVLKTSYKQLWQAFNKQGLSQNTIHFNF
jgi:2-amino-4-hydroxy-6-hydroxymethyldihydropteridine diphosphokinase